MISRTGWAGQDKTNRIRIFDYSSGGVGGFFHQYIGNPNSIFHNILFVRKRKHSYSTYICWFVQRIVCAKKGPKQQRKFQCTLNILTCTICLSSTVHVCWWLGGVHSYLYLRNQMFNSLNLWLKESLIIARQPVIFSICKKIKFWWKTAQNNQTINFHNF